MHPNEIRLFNTNEKTVLPLLILEASRIDDAMKVAGVMDGDRYSEALRIQVVRQQEELSK